MNSNRFVPIVAMIAFASLADPSILKASTEAEQTRFCQGALVRKLGSEPCGTVLRICVEGVVYRTAAMEKERLIRWQDVTAWKYFGPRRAADGEGSEAGAREYMSLQIWEWRGKMHRFNIVCGTTEDGQNVFESMKRYQPRGMLF